VLENGKPLSPDQASMLEETVNKLRVKPDPEMVNAIGLKLKHLDLLSKQF
jgi:hypothetical protein